MNIPRQAKFLYQRFHSTLHSHSGKKARVLLVVIALAVFMAGLLWTPNSAQAVDPTATPAVTQPTPVPELPTRTPFPPEFAGNSQQTVNITFAGAILVLIVVIGVIAFLPQRMDR